ncbi:MAG: radical SAM protein [Acidobacteria bacterium]|nr:radical SAM protein [Acidobacteriota bacterium]
MANKNILLIEPGYKNKYPPLGLMKLAQYHGPNGKKDRVKFIKGEDDLSVFGTAWDRIYITTLFSFEFARIRQSIDFALRVANGHADKIFVGGIAASLMPEEFAKKKEWHGIRFIQGLLTGSPSKALQLDEYSEELYSDDHRGPAIEDLVPDYGILDQIAYKYPVRDAYFAYASRGCIRKCTFCGVPKLEGDQRDAESITSVVRNIEAMYGPKKDLILMDNNVVASPRFREIIAEIRDLGFTPDARLTRGRVPIQRRVDFNQGVDARILCKDPVYLRELSTICLRPLRIAFDHLGLKVPYEKAIRYAHEFGLTSMSNYMLYNFHDTPADLFERMRLNVTLNEELGLRIWSFPMRYQPTNLPDRTHVGEKWTRYQLRAMQIILQATHGVVSGDPTFFKRAFGDTLEEFQDLLLRPHHFIFNRDWYETTGGKAQFAEYRKEFKKLTESERSELLDLIGSVDPSDLRHQVGLATTSRVKSIMRHYLPLTKEEEADIWARQRAMKQQDDPSINVPDEERVEDAGLNYEEASVTTGTGVRKRKVMAVA